MSGIIEKEWLGYCQETGIPKDKMIRDELKGVYYDGFDSALIFLNEIFEKSIKDSEKENYVKTINKFLLELDEFLNERARGEYWAEGDYWK